MQSLFYSFYSEELLFFKRLKNCKKRYDNSIKALKVIKTVTNIVSRVLVDKNAVLFYNFDIVPMNIGIIKRKEECL